MRTNATHPESGRFNARDCFPYGRAGARSGRNRGLHLHVRRRLSPRPGHGARSYSASPIDTNFLIGSYQRTTGDVALDADLPISDVKAAINTGILAYNRTFDLFGHTGSVAIVLPYFQGNLSGNVGSEGKQITREGFGDLAFRLTENLIGSPALTPAEFARREPTTTLGVGVAVVAPTGEYNSQQLINISSHRWAFRPEIGGSQPIGNWFVEGSAGMWIFTDNDDFFGGHVRGQDPIWTFQAHVATISVPISGLQRTPSTIRAAGPV
jgi:hypothetical protein